jgi:hypothetical protein
VFDQLAKMVYKEMLAASVAISVLTGRYAPQYSIGIVALFFIQFTLYASYNILLYPRFFSPIRHLPAPAGGGFWAQTKQVVAEPSGHPQRQWSAEVPNDGIMRYSVWLRERVLVTSPSALGMFCLRATRYAGTDVVQARYW